MSHKITEVTRKGPQDIEVGVEGDNWPKSYSVFMECDSVEEADRMEQDFNGRIGEELDG